MIRSARGPDTAGWAATRPAARTRGLAGLVSHDTKHCIVTGARAWMASGLCHDTPFCIMIEARV